MVWTKKRRIAGKHEHYSLSKKLKKDGKISEQFEIMLNSLTLEELIGLKLELALKAAHSPIFGLPLWRKMIDITKNALLMYAVSATRSYREASRLLGIDKHDFRRYAEEYAVHSYFQEERKEQ